MSKLTDPRSVLSAMEEYDRIGREAFLKNYGFGEATAYFVEQDGKRYDSKAIVGAAHGFQHAAPLRHQDFSDGE